MPTEFSLLLDSPEGQRSVALLGREVLIGRDDKCTLVLSDPVISRRHCRLFRYYADGDWLIEDLCSTNGTLINGEPIARSPRCLAIGDEITWGEQVGRLIALPPVASTTTGTPKGDGHAGSPSVASAYATGTDVASKCLLWAMGVLAVTLKHERACRIDTEKRLAIAEAQGSRYRELLLLLRTEQANLDQAERRHSETMKELEVLRQKLHIRTQQLDEANSSVRILATQIELYERYNTR